MARVPYLEQSDLSAENQDLLKRRINLSRALVNSPIKNDVMPHTYLKPVRYVIARQARRKFL